MTNPTRRVLAPMGVLLLVAAAAFAVQFSSYAHAPLLPDPAADLQAELAQVGRSTGCGDLRLAYQGHHMVWKGGVKDGHEPADELTLMRATLRRLSWLEQQGRCGG